MKENYYERLYKSKRVHSQTYQWEYHTKRFTRRESIQQVWIQRSLLRREVSGVTNMTSLTKEELSYLKRLVINEKNRTAQLEGRAVAWRIDLQRTPEEIDEPVLNKLIQMQKELE